MRHYGLFLVVILTTVCSFAQFPIRGIPHREASRNIVNDYCRMDYAGARLAKESWPRLKPLTTWKANPDWNGFTVVSQYDIVDAAQGLRSATVNVQYAVLGRFEIGLGYLAEPGTEMVSFRLKDVDSEWKIDDQDPVSNPHVSKLRAIAWLKSTLATEKNPANKIIIEKALKDLGATP